MSETTFSEIGKVEAILRLYEGTGFKPFEPQSFEAPSKGGYVHESSRCFLEGIDFDLVYFPLKHLGYKSVMAVTGELYASLAHPRTLSVSLGVSAKLDFKHIKELWEGIVAAAKEHGYKKISLDLNPSRNGLSIAVSAVGWEELLTGKRRLAPRSKDLVCISGNVGAAYMGLQVLERGKADFARAQEDIEKYKMLVGAYLKPELSDRLVGALEEDELYPSKGYFVTRGLADAVKRLSRDTGLGVKIYADKIPFEGNTFALGKEMDIDPVSAAMNGGDDYRILFVVPILELEKFRRDFQTFDIIGHMAQEDVGAVLVTPEGVELPMRAQGWNDED